MISILRVLGLVIIDPHLLQNTNKLLIYIQFIHSVLVSNRAYEAVF